MQHLPPLWQITAAVDLFLQILTGSPGTPGHWDSRTTARHCTKWTVATDYE